MKTLKKLIAKNVYYYICKTLVKLSFKYPNLLFIQLNNLSSQYRVFLLFKIKVNTFENTLACLTGAQMGLNHEKNWRSKIS